MPALQNDLAWLISAIKCLFNLPYVAAYGNECPMFWIGNRGELTEIPPSSGFHLAFVASDRSTVDAFYAPAMGIGAKDDGKPGLRPQYQLQTPVESILIITLAVNPPVDFLDQAIKCGYDSFVKEHNAQLLAPLHSSLPSPNTTFD
jgi:hypothetical protein